jgi:hypothetical protein
MTSLFTIAVAFVIVGWLWFFVVRPILEDWGVVTKPETVNDYEEDASVVMSRAQQSAPEHPASSLQTDARQTPDRPMIAKPTPEQMLDIFKVLRIYGVKREAIAKAWRAAGLPLDTNLWTDAAPPAPDDPPTLTPIARRPTSAKFHEDEPELQYRPLR